MSGREELTAYDCNEGSYDSMGFPWEYKEMVYAKDKADKVMDAMEVRIKELELALSNSREHEKALRKCFDNHRQRIKELEAKLNDKEQCCKWCSNDARIDGLHKRIAELESYLPKWKVLDNLAPKNKYLKFLILKDDGKYKLNVGYVRETVFGLDVVLLKGSLVISENFNALKGKAFYLEETLPPTPATDESSATKRRSNEGPF